MSARRFSIVKPEILWTGEPGRQLRKHPPEVRELAAYLLCGPLSDTWGIWHLELDTIALHTGRKEGPIIKALGTLEELLFARYDLGSQWVFVPEMPAMQFTRWPLLPHDNNLRHAKRWYEQLPRNPFMALWYEKHVADLRLLDEPDPVPLRDYVDRPNGEPTPPPEGFSLVGNKPRAIERRKTVPAAELGEWLDRIVAIYPKVEKVEKARAALVKLHPTPDLLVEIWTALQWQVKLRDWLKEGGRFAPSLYNYFVDRRWLDKPAKLGHANASTVDAIAAAADFAEQESGEQCRKPARNVHALPLPSRR